MAVSPTLSSTPTSAKKTSEDSASSKLGEIIIWASDEFVSFLTYNKMNETKYQPWWWSGLRLVPEWSGSCVDRAQELYQSQRDTELQKQHKKKDSKSDV